MHRVNECVFLALDHLPKNIKLFIEMEGASGNQMIRLSPTPLPVNIHFFIIDTSGKNVAAVRLYPGDIFFSGITRYLFP